MRIQESKSIPPKAAFWEEEPWFWGPLAVAGAFLLLAFVVRMVRRRRRKRLADVPMLDPDQLEQLMQGKPPMLVDLRSPEEFRGPKGHIRGAANIPMRELERRLPELEQREPRPLVLIDEKGQESIQAARFLQRKGFTWLYVLEGGFHAWRLERMPTYSGVQKH